MDDESTKPPAPAHMTFAAARLAAIVDSSDDAIVSKTLDGVITSWNRGAERMFGYSADEAVGRHITLIIPRERLSEEDDVLSRIRRGEKVDHFETVRRAKDGTFLDISLTVSPIRDAYGAVVGASKIARDVTERRRADRERESLLEEARRARWEAESANRVKDEFLAVLSHELRSPMNAMLGWLRILKTTGTRDPALVARAVETLERNLWVQSQVIDDLLDVSRIISGKLALNEERLDLTAVVTGCVESMRPSAEGKGVRLMLSITDGFDVIGDPARLEQIVSNLLGNAIKFTERNGSITVFIGRENDRAVITVTDSGVGIEPDFLPHLFERFRQGDTGSSRKHGGLGLGLSIVKHLVELHRGSIEAHSEGIGHGARFVVTLPVAPRRPRVASTAPAPADSFAAIQGLDVLLVEDDDDSRQALEVALADYGARVRATDSVRGALEDYASRPPDLLISDIGLPGEDGYVLIRAIREREEGSRRRTLAIAMTGFAGREDQLMTLRAGFDEHIAKPIDPEKLFERIRVLTAAKG